MRDSLKEWTRVIAMFAIILGTESLSQARAGFMPPAFEGFCEKSPSECSRQGVPIRAIALTPVLDDQMRSVNRRVNKDILQGAEVGDVWSIPINDRGDCEDIALLKRQKLIALGWPSSVLLMTVAKDEDGMGHAVLTVVTTKGDYVLDNKTSKVHFASATGYRYYSRQSFADPRYWVTIRKPGRGPHIPSLTRENLITEDDERLAAAYGWTLTTVSLVVAKLTQVSGLLRRSIYDEPFTISGYHSSESLRLSSLASSD